MDVTNRMFQHLQDAIFYLVMLAGSVVFAFIYELQYPTNSIYKLMMVGALVLLHEYYQLFKNNKKLHPRLVIEGDIIIICLVAVLIISLFFLLSPGENKTVGYSISTVWPLLLFTPNVIVFAIEFTITLKKSFIEHTGGTKKKSVTDNETQHSICNIAAAAQSV